MLDSTIVMVITGSRCGCGAGNGGGSYDGDVGSSWDGRKLIEKCSGWERGPGKQAARAESWNIS